MSDAPRWTAGTIAALLLSVGCMLPTAATMLLAVGMVVVPSTATALWAALGFSAGESLYTGGQLLVVGILGSVAASIPVSIASVLMHPVGALGAAAAFRGGARRSGLALLVAHGVTFLLGAAVALYWLVALGGAMLS